MFIDQRSQNARRQEWFAKIRENIGIFFNPDGSGVIPQMDPPWREPLWILSAFYTGEQKHIDLANRVLARYNSGPKVNYKKLREHSGREFGIFQSNIIAALYHAFRHLMTPGAVEVARWHCNALFKTFNGSAQPDYKFHGANDNMPMMATYGLILGGEAMGDTQAVKHGIWNLNQLRRHFSRYAWLSEYNSSTYTPITLCGAARIASHAKSAEARKLALDIEHRIWAELLLHFHPEVKMQAGPHCRAYCIDNANHTHSLEVIYWLVFGEEISGRNPIKSYYEHDGKEVVHFCGNCVQNIASYTEMFDFELHVPRELASLAINKTYPVRHAGRSEMMSHFRGCGGTVHTKTYMEKDFSLGTSTIPLCGGEQTNQLFVNYKRNPEVKTFRDSATVLYKYLTDATIIGEHETSTDGNFTGEMFQKNQGWVYTMQKDNVGLMTCIPNLVNAPLNTDTLKLCILFAGHYGSVTRVIANGKDLTEEQEVCPVSVETGQVYIHIVPLLPTNLPRKVAIRFGRQNAFDVLELINYEGEKREFTEIELSHVLNGYVMTVESKSKYASLEEFHAEKSDFRLTDYLFSKHRFLQFFRDDVDFELVYTPDPFGIQTESINGRPVERPMYESNQIDVDSLPFMTRNVERNFPFFPWQTKECVSFENSWLIGSRGLHGEYYENRLESLKDDI